MTAPTEPELDQELRYLVPVGRLLLPDEPDLVHLSIYAWEPRGGDWVTGLALCGRSTEQGALPDGTAVTCQGCGEYRPTYQAALDDQRRRVEAVRFLANHAASMRDPRDTVENGAWHTVWLESGKWRWTTSKMTTEQREYAADRAAAYSAFLASCDGEPERSEPTGLRWWREAGQ
ncbi:hypothetical protein [Streptomyces sp. t39]|uniref:hypothetical protein n=1 Tax=Streptomyces sp. t39 TaxID=1828156 RepID=UPI0011CDDEAE|nr:hypothetical protein [Streptomyces sp. t39]TXS50129.1 hypothetical protein EAO77_27865 [Streptomyces sp. t39]